MHPILFRFGSTIIYTYTVLLDVGLICGLMVACLEGKRRGLSLQHIIDATLWSAGAGIAGGRIGFVLANQEYFAENWLEAFHIWKGGLSFQGAFLAGLLTLFLYSVSHRLPFPALADIAALGLALGQVFGWLGCLMSGCAYGLESHGMSAMLARLALDLPDIYGISAPRLPMQLLAGASSLALFTLLWALRAPQNRVAPGFVFTLYLLLYSGSQFLLEFARGDEAIYWGPWRASQWLYLVEAAFALILLANLLRRSRSSLTKL